MLSRRIRITDDVSLPYDQAYLDRVAERMTAAARDADTVWCIFDNTARGAATLNALDLLARLSS